MGNAQFFKGGMLVFSCKDEGFSVLGTVSVTIFVNHAQSRHLKRGSYEHEKALSNEAK